MNDDAAARAHDLEAEQRRTISPAQPLGSDRIDDDDHRLAGEVDGEPPHVKHERAHRMEN